MVPSSEGEETTTIQLRLWPGVAAVTVQWLAWWILPLVAPEATILGVLAGLAGGLVVAAWWAFFSRAPQFERYGGVVLMISALAATSRLTHESIATGSMGMLFFLYAIPVLSLAFAAWAVAGRRLADGPRRLSMAAVILLACGGWTLVRSDGITSSGQAEFAWRWSETAEERLLAAPASERDAPGSERSAADAAAVWPGFRGPQRDGVIRGLRIKTDWDQSPPIELWRRPVGPGWSSCAVSSQLVYTQEQRGDYEVVAAYRLADGEPAWEHRNAARFWEANAGAGPRATPTLHGERVYTFGATGILNALDAANGTLAWSRNAASDAAVEVPYWGFSGSPLVVDGVVVVAAAGRLSAYDLASGHPRWAGPAGGDGYSSPHLLTIEGVPQVVLLSATGAASFSPGSGVPLWALSEPLGAPIVQPALTGDGNVLIAGTSLSGGAGISRVAVGRGPGGWSLEERWTSFRLKPYFNDFVVHKGHAYGFDGRLLACIRLEDGERQWKGGRYGQGQLLLLADQDLLLAVSEQGELVLVGAVPEQFAELAKFPAIEGKTWNHPALAGDVLLVRNSEEMAAFRLPLAGG